jgi:uncharacterized membrane protein
MIFGWGILVMIICMALMAFMMRGHGMFRSRSHESERQGRDEPERVLDKRLASGEIGVDEYERRRDVLHRTRKSDPRVGPER